MASERRNMFQKNKTQEKTENVLGDWVNSQSCPCDVLCTADFDPVCATNGNETKTFSNLCAMNAENKCCDAYEQLRDTSSLQHPPLTGVPRSPLAPDIHARLQDTQSQKGGKLHLPFSVVSCVLFFWNMFRRLDAIFRLIDCGLSQQETTENVLAEWVNSQSCPCDIACPAIYDPVCATNGYDIKTFANPCTLNAENECCGTCAWTPSSAAQVQQNDAVITRSRSRLKMASNRQNMFYQNK
ncbi:hypothetical protein AAG570_002236 [Ranatra chinensis]|uniref:Kazal-like domain-containing protein n=1 Tax=Ranatra chinensis TaxID=642074 RepID=A0ABD0YVB7_9HEMI